MNKELASLPLSEKVAYSKKIIIEANEKFNGNIAVTFTGGKDSLVMLHIVKEASGGRVPFPVLNIDTSVKFKEIYEFRDRIAREWMLNLIVVRNEKALKEIEIAANKEECCKRLKIDAMNSAIVSNGWGAVLTAIRWDEQAVRVNEEYFSPKENPPHTRIQPILHFSELDIWTYIKQHNLPYCELYKKGYRSLGCEPCTRPHGAAGIERGGRSHDKEEIMRALRDAGYF